VEIFNSLEKKLADTTWTESQDPEFINNLTQVKNIVENLSTQIFVFLDYFEQYAAALRNSPIFQQYDDVEESQNGEVSPTQTSGNRAERRAAQRKTPFDVVKPKGEGQPKVSEAQGVDNA
jgi:hypothetical protein